MKSNINSVFRESSGKRIYQGDIFRDLQIIISYTPHNPNEIISELCMPYLVVLSQDCDLDRDYKSFFNYKNLEDKNNIEKLRPIHDKCLPSILLSPAFPAEQVRIGKHLKDLNKFIMDNKGKETKSPWKSIINNETPRYHFIGGDTDLQVPDLVLDFKRYYTLPIEYLYSCFKEKYLASLNELFRECLSDRFASYLSRIGLPEFQK
jgi:hypothetical protein